MLGQNHFAEAKLHLSFFHRATYWATFNLHIRNLTIHSSLNLHVNSYYLNTLFRFGAWVLKFLFYF
jgi:hypothetical protein